MDRNFRMVELQIDAHAPTMGEGQIPDLARQVGNLAGISEQPGGSR